MTKDRAARLRTTAQRWLMACVVLAAATVFFVPLHSSWHLVSTGPGSSASPITTICLIVSAVGTAIAGAGAILSGLAARSAARTAAMQAAASPPAQDRPASPDQ
jgi:hypothetical protein